MARDCILLLATLTVLSSLLYLSSISCRLFFRPSIVDWVSSSSYKGHRGQKLHTQTVQNTHGVFSIRLNERWHSNVPTKGQEHSTQHTLIITVPCSYHCPQMWGQWAGPMWSQQVHSELPLISSLVPHSQPYTLPTPSSLFHVTVGTCAQCLSTNNTHAGSDYTKAEKLYPFTTKYWKDI